MNKNFSEGTMTLRQPDDWHVHLRDGDVLKAVLPSTARVFRRAVVMPNLTPPITSLDSAISYRKRIISFLPNGITFTPLMTLYLTDSISTDLIKEGFIQRTSRGRIAQEKSYKHLGKTITKKQQRLFE